MIVNQERVPHPEVLAQHYAQCLNIIDHLSNCPYRFIEKVYIGKIIVIELSPSPTQGYKGNPGKYTYKKGKKEKENPLASNQTNNSTSMIQKKTKHKLARELINIHNWEQTVLQLK